MTFGLAKSVASRRRLMQAGAGLLGGGAAACWPVQPRLRRGQTRTRQLPGRRLGQFSVFIGVCLPRTGTYAVPGEDELKGFELAIEHLNTGNELIRKISPHTTKGVLGKEVKHGVADSQAKPNVAVQAQSRFITQDKAMMLVGSVSSAVAVALNKLAEREKVIYLPGISGSNDTTGKDCVRYSFRQCFYAQTAANALAPVLTKALGKNKKIAFLTPDYTYGHTVRQSMEEFLPSPTAGPSRPTRSARSAAPDYSSYMLNIANSGADVFININFGNDAVQSIKQAKQFGVLDKMTLVVPYNTPFLAKDVGPDIMQGVYAATDFWWTLEDKFPIAKGFVEAFDKKHGYKPEWGANSAYMQIAMWADAVERAKAFYPLGRDQGLRSRPDTSIPPSARYRSARRTTSWCRPVIIVRGKKKAQHEGRRTIITTSWKSCRARS